MSEQEKKETCFVICPIGPEGSDIRDRSDEILKNIICPAVEEFGYEVIRADHIGESGNVTTQVIEKLIAADMAIADLSGLNPNVVYELGIRHATRKPVVLMTDDLENFPFDVGHERTILFAYPRLSSAAECREKIAIQIRAYKKNPDKVHSPVSFAIDMNARGGDPTADLVTAKLDTIISTLRSGRPMRTSQWENMVVPVGSKLTIEPSGLFHDPGIIVSRAESPASDINEFPGVSRSSSSSSMQSSSSGASSSESSAQENPEG